jgi:spore germination protein YaaH
MLDRGGPARDNSSRMILVILGVVGVILLVLVLPPVKLLGGGGDDSPSSGAAAKPPEGFELLSKEYKPEKPKEAGPYNLTLKLLAPTNDNRNLGIYSYNGGKWERLASAALSPEGTTAMGQVSTIPSRLYVLRRVTGAVQVSGVLPGGNQPDGAAIQVLGTINVADYTPRPDGTINGAPTQLQATRGAMAPTVRAVQQGDIDVLNNVLSTPNLREAHINALVALATAPGNTGIDLDYSRVNAARKADFTAFITVLSDKLHQQQKSLSITLPLPVKAGVQWDTQAYDWEELSKRADQIRLLPEPDPSAYYQRMTEVLSFLKGKADLRRVALVISRQSYSKGGDGVQTLSLRDALQLASSIEVRTNTPIAPNSSVVVVGKNIFQDDGASGVRWDEGASAVSFTYPGRGGPRTVWLENTLSVAFKLDLARRFSLGGVVIDDITQDSGAPQIWELLRGFSETGNVQLVAPNGAFLRPTWKVQAGSSEPGAKGNVVWKAPAQPGAYDVSLIVSDGVIRAEQKVTLTVGQGATTGSPTASGTPRPTTPTAGSTPTAVGTPRPGTTPTGPSPTPTIRSGAPLPTQTPRP